MAHQTKRKLPEAGHSLLGREHSHSAWVTNDLDRAVEIFSRRYGVQEFRFIEGVMPSGGHIRVAFAWAGGQVIEVIAANGPGTEFYNEMLPEGAFAIRFHHLGFIVHDQAGWDSLEADLAAQTWPIAHKTLTGSFIDAYYVKAEELGHYLEFVRPFDSGIAFYASVPAN
ncbi:glyoxalase/bleomycin resistance protein/dioxygenase superfamily protein [Novosphingobium sp. PhB55]|uniref:VOC family protein n=1 Tax=Novosphingobium sp. PhB55 TaxID=2485106 RepID=UPI0010D1E28A|nr:VOC family protein [Novosphingobium sp. PhB55]TDW59952.1 glyoxalase/bleomycin resistance protein/dioxygenase superfamily protein [Novosphingobium sp. PhB55]